MIRAWTILFKRTKNPEPLGFNDGKPWQYPIFSTLREAKQFRREGGIKDETRIVRCQIRIEGTSK